MVRELPGNRSPLPGDPDRRELSWSPTHSGEDTRQRGRRGASVIHGDRWQPHFQRGHRLAMMERALVRRSSMWRTCVSDRMGAHDHDGPGVPASRTSFVGLANALDSSYLPTMKGTRHHRIRPPRNRGTGWRLGARRRDTARTRKPGGTLSATRLQVAGHRHCPLELSRWQSCAIALRLPQEQH